MKLLEQTRQRAAPPSVRARIADETRMSHEALHTHPVLSRLMAADLGRKEYATILSRHLAFFEAAEQISIRLNMPHAFSFQPELRLLRDDLRDHGWPGPYAGLTLQTPCQALGMLYVLHGSRFGAQVIHRNLRKALPMHRHNFFGDVIASDRWRLLLSELETKGAQSRRYSEILHGAETTFSAFGTAMQTAEARPRQ